MHLSLNFVVALLATSALAAPTPKQKEHKSQSAGSFKVPSRARPNHKQNVDTHHEMSRAFAKFNLDFILAKPDVNFTPKKISLSLPKSAALPARDAKLDISLQEIPDIVGDLLDNFLPKNTKAPKSKTTTSKKPKSTLPAVSSAAPYVSPVSSYVAPAPVTTSSVPPPPPPPETTSSSSAAVISSEAPASSSSAETYAPAPETTVVATSSAAPETSAPAPVTSSHVAETSAPAPVTSSYVAETSAPAPVSSYVPETSAPAPVSSYAPETSAPVSSAAPITSTAPASSEPAPTTFSSVYQPSFSFAPTTTEPAPATSTSKKVAATVHASPEQNQSEYLSPVTVGGQSLTLNFDTGSADLWVFSSKLGADRIGGHSAFDPSKSSTWQPADGSTWKISYGDGSTASGDVGFDAVTIGGATATRQAVELATAISDSFAKDVNNDGLVGLGWSSINTIKPQKQKTFFENIMGDLDQPLFTADLRKDASGSYEFGTIDAAKYSGDIHYTPIDNSKGFWQFPSTTYSVGGQTYANANAAPAIADTGTSIVLADSNAVNAYYNQVQGATVSSTAGGWVFPCSAQLPEFGVAIGDTGFIATIPGSEMVYAKLDTSGTSCFGGLQSNAGINYQIYGAVLLKQYFAVFNGGAKTFGLAKKTYA